MPPFFDELMTHYTSDEMSVYGELYSALSWLYMYRFDFECFRRFITVTTSALDRPGAVENEEIGSFPFTHDFSDCPSAILALEEIFSVCHRFGTP